MLTFVKRMIIHQTGTRLAAHMFAKRNRATHIQTSQTGEIPINAIALV
jgi:hypothetical protein